MTTSVDDPVFLARFVAQHSNVNRSGSLTARRTNQTQTNQTQQNGSATARYYTHTDNNNNSTLTSRAPRTRHTLTAQSAYGHPPTSTYTPVTDPNEVDPGRTWETLSLRDLTEVRQPRRYFSQRIRRVVYGGNYWSAPMRTTAQRARGMTEESVTVKAVDRKFLPVPELIKRIEEQQAILARQAEEARMAPIRAKNRLIRLQRRGIDDTSLRVSDDDDDNDDSSILDADHIDLMSLLDHQTLHLLKQDFSSHEKALSLQEFVEVMRRYLPDSIGEVKLAANLVKFFESVDVNGDGTMEWNEFTNFITDAGMGPTGVVSGSSAVGVGGSGGVAGESRQEVEEYRKSTLTDEFDWNQPLEKLFYFDALDHLLAFQAGSKSFQVFRGKKMNHLYDVKGHTAELLSAEYVSKHHWLCTSANDRTIRFWDPADQYRPVRNLAIHADQTQVCMRWANTQNLLFTATDQRQIKAWKIEKSHSIGGVAKDSFIHSSSSSSASSNTNKLHHYSTEVVSTFAGQNDITLDLLVLENMSALASASLDTTIALFDINTHQRTSVLKGGHKRGVFQLAYHPEYHVLVSAAYEHAAVVWNPYVSQQICKLGFDSDTAGHQRPLCGVAVVPNSPQILTADQGGVIKAWDIRNFGCVQTIYVEDKDTRVDSLHGFVSVAPHKRIVSCSHKMFVHDSLTSSASQAPQIADLDPTSRVIYSSVAGCFLSAAGQTVKVWTGANGILERVFRNLLPDGAEITTLTLDDSQKKFILGDTHGGVRVYNLLNGALMKSLILPGAGEITGLEYVPQLKNILVTAWDGSVLLLDETLEEGLGIVKPLKGPSPTTMSNQHKESNGSHATTTSNTGVTSSEIVTSCYSDTLCLFATGSSSGLVSLWDYRSHVSVGDLQGHASEITALTFLDPYPLLASADHEGNVCVWVVRPLVINVGKCVLRLVNTVKGKPVAVNTNDTTATTTNGARKTSEICPITALTFWTNVDARSFLGHHYGDPGIPPPATPFAYLYGGDVNGVIRCWDLWKAISERWKLLPFYTHDRLIPTGKEFIPDTGGIHGGENEEDPEALTEYEKMRIQKQIQANGLATGATGTNKRQHMAEGDEEESASPSDVTETVVDPASLPPRRPSLPSIVSSLVASNVSSFSHRAAALARCHEIGLTMGVGSVEYEAALASVPGATAGAWKYQQMINKIQQQRELMEAEAAAAAKKAGASQQSSTPSQRRRALLIEGITAEEKTNSVVGSTSLDVDSQPTKSHSKHPSFHRQDSGLPNDTPTPIASSSNTNLPATATSGAAPTTRTLSTKLLKMAASTGPQVSNNFSRGTAKLIKTNRATALNGTLTGMLGGVGVANLSVNVGSDKKSSDDVDSSSLDPSLTGVPLPPIPTLPLSNLLSQTGGGGIGSNTSTGTGTNSFGSSHDVSSFMPKAVLRHSRTNDYVEYRRVHREVMNDLERHARTRTSMLQGGDIKLVHWWVGHTDAIRDLHLVREDVQHQNGRILPTHPRSIALISCSFDKKVCLWTSNGQTLGHLQQGRTEDVLSSYGIALDSGSSSSDTLLKPDWSFQSDVRGRYEKSQATARKVLHRLNTARTHTAASDIGPNDATVAGSRLQSARDISSSIVVPNVSLIDDDLSLLDTDELLRQLSYDSDSEGMSNRNKVSNFHHHTFLTDFDSDSFGMNLDLGQPKLSSRSYQTQTQTQHTYAHAPIQPNTHNRMQVNHNMMTSMTAAPTPRSRTERNSATLAAKTGLTITNANTTAAATNRRHR